MVPTVAENPQGVMNAAGWWILHSALAFRLIRKVLQANLNTAMCYLKLIKRSAKYDGIEAGHAVNGDSNKW